MTLKDISQTKLLNESAYTLYKTFVTKIYIRKYIYMHIYDEHDKKSNLEEKAEAGLDSK